MAASDTRSVNVPNVIILCVQASTLTYVKK